MEDKERCTLGIIGAGNILDSHLRALEQLPRIDVTAVCDTHVERRKQIAAQLNIRSYADYRDLLAEPPDAVLVALPHGLHCAVTVDALRAGCHVLVEKPMAVDVEECRQMLSAAEMCGRQLLVAESASSLPGPVRTGEKFARGDLGEFFTGGIVNERFYFHEGRPAWFLDPVMSGGGMFANVGLHRLAVTRACLPNLTPISVSGSVSHQPEWQVEACTTALVRYAEGGSVFYEEVGYFPRPEWLNAGTHYIFAEGIVTWDDRRWRMMSRSGAEYEEDLPPNPGYLPIYENLLKAMCGQDYTSRARECAADTAIVQAAYASARAGREIDLRSPEWCIEP
ncbi:MAG: Gfo/Idh/MocA family oxidoreductase [Gemmatimonadetes bacterium]|jgi:predicted dehydrogenase|nr:Gfo/Idh/MocA family oxidoreductase [Gemmatimonadota bacterium]